jgi:hypothetical protein
MVMGHGRLFHRICLHSLLIAVAIQGVTPDAQDLASFNALRLFCPALADTSNLDDNNDLPDDVCGPVEFETDSVVRGRSKSDDQPLRAFVSIELHVLKIQSNALRSAPGDGAIMRINDMIDSMCRLDC